VDSGRAAGVAQHVDTLNPGVPASTGAADAAVGAPAHDEYVMLRDKVRVMFSYNAISLAGHAIGAIVIELIYAAVAPYALKLAWGAAFALLCAVRVALAVRYARDEPQTVAGLRARRQIWVTGTLLSAAMWGWAGWAFYPYGNALQQIVLVLVVYTFCVACIPILAPQFRLYLAFLALIYVPTMARVATQADAWGVQTAIVMAVAMAMTIVLGRNYAATFDALSRLQLRTEALMEQLRAEKAVSDAARQQAEIANRAKTQFFTAASHDLRQPLHAMGLFAEALRQRAHEPEVAQLVNSINESVDALEGLFSELLDINRIDSGRVEVHAEHFELGEILRKLRLHFEPSAFEKGLALRLRGAQHVVHADPLLVERIARNLVSNAIRYTNDGTVLVSARRRGEQVLLQVWDTGLGIREEERVRIFEEFYQVPNTDAVRPEQRKGLGLGLAIVKRLADLMGAPLAVRSEPGRGTVFTLTLPLGRAPRLPAAARPGKGPVALTLDGRLMVIVEDEPAVRGGLEVLLQGWGAKVVSFDSAGAARQWAEQSDPAVVKPDLLIVDYRLENGTTGVEAIKALRARFGAKLPAIVATGSTMSGHDQEAQANDFHLLIKPVVPNKLRAMIAFKLGVGRS
ncbi:MAG TPA: ATP-binding protein, partial [Burkholderiaceae bacterium]|nr:ATP-binding protein [Burkholderiaceae bacterium]